VLLNINGVQIPVEEKWRLLSVKLADGNWLHSAARVRTRNILPPLALLIETGLIYLGVMIPLVARHPPDFQTAAPTQPAPRSMRGLASGAPPLEPQGPDDIRSLIDSFNAAEQRVNAMLTEKDVMLGAIGHDLKTPLASLRVRIESVEDEDERTKMAATVDEMVHILDDILILARLGKSAEALVLTDVSALVEMVADELDGEGSSHGHSRAWKNAVPQSALSCCAERYAI
jgi:signal transduction histidine kinase